MNTPKAFAQRQGQASWGQAWFSAFGEVYRILSFTDKSEESGPNAASISRNDLDVHGCLDDVLRRALAGETD